MLKVEKLEQNDFIVSFYNVNRFNTLISETIKQQLLKMLIVPSSRIILNFNGIHFIDSHGFETLQELLDTANEKKCKFLLANLSDELKELIGLMRLEDVFEIYEYHS